MRKAESELATQGAVPKVIGSTTIYIGTEHNIINGFFVRIHAVLKNGARPDIDAVGPGCAYIDDDEELARAGGVTVFDRVTVQPWIEQRSRFSFASSDARAEDLACFEGLGQSPRTAR